MADETVEKHGSLIPRSDGGFDVRLRPWTLAEEAELDREAGRPTWGTAGAGDPEP